MGFQLRNTIQVHGVPSPVYLPHALALVRRGAQRVEANDPTFVWFFETWRTGVLRAILGHHGEPKKVLKAEFRYLQYFQGQKLIPF